MVKSLWLKSLSLFTKQQTNILSAAFIIMITVILSQILGLIRQRLLVAIFGASNTLGVYLASTQLPDFLFQVTIAGALSSAFIPVFSYYIVKKKDLEGHVFASNLLCIGLAIFAILSVFLLAFSEFFCRLIAPNSSLSQIQLMANLMRIIVVGQLFFIIGSFFSAVLQCYNHFFIPGFALALYNFGIIVGIILLSPITGIYSAAYGVIIGAVLFALLQLPLMKKVGFGFHFSFFTNGKSIKEVLHLMWPRTVSIGIYRLGVLLTVVLVSFVSSKNFGRNYVIFDYAQTLAFAPIVLFGQTIAQAAFPILSKQKDDKESFKATFVASFNQMLYLVLPFSVLFLVLRIPIVRLIYGASQFDWEATRLTGYTLAWFSISIFAQALVNLVSRAFYALHDTMTPLIIGALTTIFMVALGGYTVLFLHKGVASIAFAYSTASILNLLILMIFLNKKIGNFMGKSFFLSVLKIFLATLGTAYALYIPLHLLDKLVFDTTKTINLIMLTGISSFAGLCLYLFLTWFLAVHEASTYLLLFKRVGNWQEVLKKSKETIDGTRVSP